MSIPSWLLDVFAAAMLLVAAVSAAQLAVGYPSRWAHVDADITVSHLLMGIAMAGMLVASLQTLPNVAWEVIFAIMTAWFAWSAWKHAQGRGPGTLAGGHYAPHLVHSAAMLYMFLALAAPAAGGGSGMSGMGGMGGSGGMQTLRLPVLAFVFVLLLAGYTVRDLDRWAGSDGYFHVLRHGPAPAGPALATATAGATVGPTAGTASAAVTQATADRAATGGGVATVAQPQAARDTAPGAQPAVAAPGDVAALIFAPGVVKACRVAMGVTMAFMLIIMI
jgi:hypothetical protein